MPKVCYNLHTRQYQIGRPNQSNTTGNKRDSGHGTPPAAVERTDEEVHHDAPLRLLAELRDQGKRQPDITSIQVLPVVVSDVGWFCYDASIEPVGR